MKGRCACGALEFEVSSKVHNVGNCHCSVCRRSGGAPFGTYAQTDASGLTITAGADRVTTYRSSSECERTFCSRCGGNFTYRFSGVSDQVWIAAGLFEEAPELAPGHHMFVGSKAWWYEIRDDLPQFEEFPPQPGD